MSRTHSTRVVVTGIGTINALGRSVDETWAGLLAARSGIGRIRRFDAESFGLKTWIAGEISDFAGPSFAAGQAIERLDRCSQFALVAAHEALLGAGLVVDAGNRDRVAVIMGAALGGTASLAHGVETLLTRGSRRVNALMFPKSMSNASAAAVSLYSGARGPAMTLNSACASATDAIGIAADLIRAGRVDVAIAGGSEAAILPVMMASLDRMGAITSRYNDSPARASRPFDRDRDGFVIAEGAGVLVLESERHARQRQAPMLAELAGYAAASDAYHLTAPAPDGDRALGVMRAALADASATRDDVVHINAHGTSTRLNDALEARVIGELLGERVVAVPVSATKSATGHMGGATGGLEAVLCVKSCESGLAPPTLNFEQADPECHLDIVSGSARAVSRGVILSNSFGFGGHCACLAFRPC
ncbi:MAG: beta-ketoacyl-[acyl-carrier-protein] synthase family protein [Gammaproteobacteria bacterium]|nr:beta-ketoacyl-[acyl-carrier-protein] synthase family protein [Gammaproteobacteria bacterium]